MDTNHLKSLSDHLLIEACNMARELKLDKSFIELLENEINRRDI